MSFYRKWSLCSLSGQVMKSRSFVSPPLKVVSRSFIGRTRDHVRLQLKDLKSGYTLYAKAWRMASSFPAEIVDKTIKLAYTPRFDFYNGNVNIDISIKRLENMERRIRITKSFFAFPFSLDCSLSDLSS